MFNRIARTCDKIRFIGYNRIYYFTFVYSNLFILLVTFPC
jgi:hypothetical protein